MFLVFVLNDNFVSLNINQYASDIHHIMLRPSNKGRASDYDCTEETVKVVWQCDKSAFAHVSEINLLNIDSLHSICVCVCDGLRKFSCSQNAASH